MNETSIYILLASTGLLFTLALLVVLFVLHYQKRLLQQKIILQTMEQERQQDLLNALVEGQEQERGRLAKDLHDDVGALLMATNLQLNQLERTLDHPTQRSTFLTLCKTLLQDSIRSVRAVSHDLLPPTLERFGLLVALQHLSGSFSRTDQFIVKVEAQLGQHRLTKAQEIGLYRVIQELLNNTAKHSQGNQAWISLNLHQGVIHLSYQDDGVGFDSEQQTQGLGLKNLHTRITMLGGHLTIASQPNHGFSAKCQIPLHPKTSNHE